MEFAVKETDIIKAAGEGMDAFIKLFTDTILNTAGGTLTAENMAEMNIDQITLIAYTQLRDEVMDGGFVQLIHNGYGGFIFNNPFAKMMRVWGLKELAKLIFNARKLYLEHGKEIEEDCTDEEFMGLFEKFPQFDDMDDEFVENEEQWTEAVAHYVDEHIENFATVEK